MTSLVFNPTRLTNDVDKMVHRFFGHPDFRSECDCDCESGFAPKVNIRDNKEDLRLTFELPGVNKDEIKVTIQDNVLSVSGERKVASTETEGEWVRNEITTGSFCRSFTLPDTVNTDSISADYTNGLLEVKLTKREEVKPKEIEVTVK
jgi:HSP20 family protein